MLDPAEDALSGKRVVARLAAEGGRSTVRGGTVVSLGSQCHSEGRPLGRWGGLA